MTDQAAGTAQASGAGGQVQGQQATQQGGQQAPSQQQQQGGAPPAGSGGQAAQGAQQQQGQQDVTVPLHVVQSLEGKLKEQKAANLELQTKLQGIQGQQQMSQMFFQGQNGMQYPAAPPPPIQQPQGGAQQQPAPAQQQAADPFAGMDDGDLVSVKDIRSAIKALGQTQGIPDTITSELQALRSGFAQLQVMSQDRNFEQTIREYLPEVINANPQLQTMIVHSPNPLQAALTVAKMSPRYLQSQQQQQAQQGAGGQEQQQQQDPLAVLQQIIENATKPGSPASANAAGQGGAFTGASRYADMDPRSPEFDAEVRRVLGS